MSQSSKNPNRREIAALLAASAGSTAIGAAPLKLPSATFRFEDLKVKRGAQNTARDVLDGLTHSGFHIDMHQTELAAGKMPHAAHKHAHEEMLMLREGTLEVTIEDKVTKIGPGGVVYVASNEQHGWKNVGETTAHYFVMALGRP